ncbi:hypothetical protein Pcinc_021510 [Petrolisthes cinctipes]|uniref:Protein XRP2 n=1 Tax=Petrolisthes cinctipes TaxID=88211 RepID=A0AAE1FFW7_PETCI|nr:hypothetical protein Pcinc_021510 [Petrolisthes cinctipes]
MGCIYSRNKKLNSECVKDSTEPAKTYSWDKKEKVNPADFTIEDLNGGEAGRLPGTIAGQQFIVQNCRDSCIYLLDHINTITIDDCSDCTIFVGPTTGSVFLRDCQGCVVAAACGQLRTRDCNKLDLLLLCQTQPVIEASTKIRVGCLQASYPQLLGQFGSAGLSVFNNKWADVYDFTPVDGETNWSILTSHLTHAFTLPHDEKLSGVGLSVSPQGSVVPYTLGRPALTSGHNATLVLVLPHPQHHQTAHQFIEALTSRVPDVEIQLSREVKLDEPDAKRILGDAWSGLSSTGMAVVALLCVGPGVSQACTIIAQEKNTGQSSSPLLYVTSETSEGAGQVSAFLACPAVTSL